MQGRSIAQVDTAPTATVLVLISTHIVGGPGKGLLQLLPALTANGRVRPILCTFNKVRAADSPFIRACKEHGIPVTVLSQRFNLDPRPYRALRALIAAEDVDIIQTHGYKENVFGYFLARTTGKPWICFMHGTTDENIKVRLYHKLDGFTVRAADRVLSVSHELARRVLPADQAARVTVVDNAILPRTQLPTRFAVAQWKRQWRIGADPLVSCIGRLSSEKGQDLLLAAAARLRAQGYRFQIVLVGDGPDRLQLTQQCKRLGLDGRAVFIGHQPEVDVVYAASDIVALPSRKEGMPNVVLEAMQHGLPLVAMRVGAVPDMLTDKEHALLVSPGDVDAFARALVRLIDDREYARRLGRAAKAALYPRFSVANRTETMERIYAEVGKKVYRERSRG